MHNNNDIGFLIKLIHNTIGKVANQVLAPYGITMAQGRFLEYLHEQNGQTTQKDLETHFQLSHPTTVGILKRLEEKKLITTRFDAHNGRIKIVELTEEELSIHEKMVAFRTQMETTLQQGLSPDEKENLVMVLQKLLHNIQEIPDTSNKEH